MKYKTPIVAGLALGALVVAAAWHGGGYVGVNTPTDADYTAYGQCMQYYHNEDHCRADVFGFFAIDPAATAGAELAWLHDRDWSPLPGTARLYPPVTVVSER